MLIVLFFFFKQKTAYEVRISDWSSDVCSSDLDRRRGERQDPESLLRDAAEIVGLFHRYTPLKEAASEPIVSAHPSTRTNSSSLNGIEMIDGDSIIMPSAISVEATTRSMMRKGRRIRSPIWKRVFSAQVTKAGGRTERGTPGA